MQPHEPTRESRMSLGARAQARRAPTLRRERVDLGAVLFVIGWLLLILGGAMLLPLAADLSLPRAGRDAPTFMASCLVTAFAGSLLVLAFRRPALELSLHSAFVLTTLSWFVLGLFAALPLLFGETQLSFADAYFEAISGLTTTGSTVIVGLDALPAGLLLWRSLLQWLGGIGIVVGATVILPFLRVGGMQLFRLESSEKSDKVMPSLGALVTWMGLTYLLLTMTCVLLYDLLGMSGFDAVNHAMTTLSTGGFSTHDASFAAFDSLALDLVATVFMLAGALPFVRYVETVRGRPGALWRDSQVRLFLAFLLIVCLGFALMRSQHESATFIGALRYVAFNVVSVVTTTGYATTDYSLWGPFFVVAFLGLTVVGSCTGSTAGGVKFFRFEILWLGARNHIRRLFSPHVVISQTYGGKTVSGEVLLSVVSFVFLWFATWGLTSVALGAAGLDMVTAISGAATALANVGPGLGTIIGPAGNFAPLSDASKWLLSLAMVVGRLEIFTVIVLLVPDFWRE